METGETIGYGYVREVPLAFAEAVTKTEAALKIEGFGVLCEIDIQAKLKEKLGVEFPKYTILGACNPPIAFRASTCASIRAKYSARACWGECRRECRNAESVKRGKLSLPVTVTAKSTQR